MSDFNSFVEEGLKLINESNGRTFNIQIIVEEQTITISEGNNVILKYTGDEIITENFEYIIHKLGQAPNSTSENKFTFSDKRAETFYRNIYEENTLRSMYINNLYPYEYTLEEPEPIHQFTDLDIYKIYNNLIYTYKELTPDIYYVEKNITALSNAIAGMVACFHLDLDFPIPIQDVLDDMRFLINDAVKIIKHLKGKNTIEFLENTHKFSDEKTKEYIFLLETLVKYYQEGEEFEHNEKFRKNFIQFYGGICSKLEILTEGTHG